VSELTLAIERFWGNPKEFTRFQVVTSRLVMVKYPKALRILIELVPSAKPTPATVLTTIWFGVERYPIESRTVTVWPGYRPGNITTAFMIWDVSISTTLVLAFTVIVWDIPI